MSVTLTHFSAVSHFYTPCIEMCQVVPMCQTCAKFLQWRACEADFRRREIKGIPCVRSVEKTHPKQGLKPLLKAVAS